MKLDKSVLLTNIINTTNLNYFKTLVWGIFLAIFYTEIITSIPIGVSKMIGEDESANQVLFQLGLACQLHRARACINTLLWH